ncbi:hypothetical protein EC988_006581, partial [Linderina pennispora]
MGEREMTEWQPAERDGEAYVVKWTAAEATDSLVAVRLLVRHGDLGDERQVGQFSVFVSMREPADMPIADPNDESSSVATPDTAHEQPHTYYSLVRFNRQRVSAQGDEPQEAREPHPLLSKWIAEDSPAFRSAIHSMEEQALANRSKYKELSRSSALLHESYVGFMRSFAEATGTLASLPVFKPLHSAFVEPLRRDLERVLGTVCAQWDSLVADRAKRLYENTFRSLDARRTEFDDASNHYYDELGKHLKTKASSEDAKRDHLFARRRSSFDLA